MKSLKEIKFKELIFHNFALKILAVIIAVLLWIIIVNIDNPSYRRTISGIQVNLINGEVLTDKGYVYQIESGSTVSIVVKAPQSVVDDLEATDFYAYADLSERSPDSDTAKIYVSCIKKDAEDQVDIVSQKTEFVQLAIDNRVDKDLDVEVEIAGNPGEGYVVGDFSTSPTTIRISGAEATVDRIKTSKIVYDVSNMIANINEAVKPVFYDENGNEVNTDKLELSRNTVQLYIELLPTKWVPVQFTITGEPAEGYELTDSDQTIKSIRIAAKKELLESMSSITIPSDVVDITGATENKEFEILLSTYLPSGYKIVSSTDVLTVTATIEKVSDSTVYLPVEEIVVNGKDSKLEYTITADNGGNVLDIGVSGVESVINKLSSEDISASIDLSGKTAGKYTMKVSFENNEKYTINKTYYLKVEITDPTDIPDNTETDSETEETDGAEETTEEPTATEE